MVRSLKVLGIYVDDQMTWDEHINRLKSKTTATVKHLHRVNKLLPIRAKLKIRQSSYIQPKLGRHHMVWMHREKQEETPRSTELCLEINSRDEETRFSN